MLAAIYRRVPKTTLRAYTGFSVEGWVFESIRRMGCLRIKHSFDCTYGSHPESRSRCFGLRQVFKKIKTRFTGDDDIQLSVTVNIHHGNLQTSASAGAVIDDVPPPFDAF